jgi:hypothetical protein
MAGEEQAGGAGGLGGEAETASGKGGLDLDLAKAGNERPAFQPFFQGPGGVAGSPRLDNEKTRGVEAGAHKTGLVRTAPFPGRFPRQAPQDQPVTICPCRLGDHGQREAEGRRGVAVAFRLELVKGALLEPVQEAGPLFIIVIGSRR